MKLSTIYRRAAQRIDSDRADKIFRALDPFYKDNDGLVSYFFKLFPVDVDWTKETRVLALLFMSAICESEDN